MTSYQQDAPQHPALIDAKVDIAVLQSQYKLLQEEIASMRVTLGEVKELLSEAKGGWRTAMLIGGAGATFATIASWLVAHVTFR